MPPSTANNFLALVGATVYISPTDPPVQNAVILIESGKIAAVETRSRLPTPPSAEVLDCSGLTITAGLWNSHVHFFERKWSDVASIPAAEVTRQLQDMLTRFGFTSVFDTGSMWSNTRRLRDRVESGEVLGPKIRSTGEGLVPPGALPSDQILSMMGSMKFPAPEIADEDHAASAARNLLESGVDGIKIFASSPRSASLPESVMRRAVAEAHRANKPVFVHPNSASDVCTAVEAGVDIIAHTTPHSGPWEESLLSAMADHRVALTPTLTLWKYYARHDRVSAQDKIVATELGQLRAWVSRGGTVLFGTDLGAVESDPTEEYVLMSEAGMTFPHILASLTTAPALRFGDAAKLGRIAPGFDADLAIFRHDPAKDIRAFADVRYTLRAGKIIFCVDS